MSSAPIVTPNLQVKEITDIVLRKNFENLYSYFLGNNQFLGFPFQELVFASAQTSYAMNHNLGFIPQDIVILKLTGTGTVTFLHSKFTTTQLFLNVTGPCRIRFLYGTYWNYQTAVNSSSTDTTGFSSSPPAVISTPAASTIAAWDASKNFQANAFIYGTQSVPAAASSTTLTASSPQFLQLTGTAAQNVVLPLGKTMKIGQHFIITNRSSASVTILYATFATAQTLLPGSQAVITCLGNTTDIGVWDIQYTISGVTAATQPTVQKFLSGAGTYTTPVGVQYLRVRLIGGGGGGAGSGTTTGSLPGDGGPSTFSAGAVTLTGGGGSKGVQDGNGGAGGIGTLAGAAAAGTTMPGGQGGGIGDQAAAPVTGVQGGQGGNGFFGGGGSGGSTGGSGTGTGKAGGTNTGAGGGGGGLGRIANEQGGAGGGAGGFVEALITGALATTYAYSVGAAGAAGGAGTSGSTGGAGALGYIEVTEYYASYAANTSIAVNPNYFLGGPTSGAAAPPTFRPLTAADIPIIAVTLPTVQKFLSGSGTYTTPAGVAYIRVRLVGAGAGGSSSGTAAIVAGGPGGNTTFGASLLTANGGTGGTTSADGGSGGNQTVNSPAIEHGSTNGGDGQGGLFNGATTTERDNGGNGGSSFFAGAGAGGGFGHAGSLAKANSGSGGGGGGGAVGTTVNFQTGSGGGSGAYVDAIITNPSTSYAYSVGAKGAGGTAGTTGFAGGDGADGKIVVTEYYPTFTAVPTNTFIAPYPDFFGSGTTYNPPYAFLITQGSATAGATYTNNGVTYTVKSTVASGTLVYMTGASAPQASGTLTKSGGTGDTTLTFTGVKAPICIYVEAIGGGGGGGGAGGAPTAGGTGGNTTMTGAALLFTAQGAAGGASAGAGGGAPSTPTFASPFIPSFYCQGSMGNATPANVAGSGGGAGAASFYGAGGEGGVSGILAGQASVVYGAGGGGAFLAAASGAGGGAAGSFIKGVIPNPLPQYTYSIGAGGTAGAGTNLGGVGAQGILSLEARYQ